MEKSMMVGGMVPRPGQKKEQTVIVSLPPQVKRYLTLMTNFNSAVWVIAGLTLWFSEDPLPNWAWIGFAIAIFCCVVLIPIFINFINNVPWGQKE